MTRRNAASWDGAASRRSAARLVAVAVVLINLGVLLVHLDRGDWRIGDGSALAGLAALTLANLTATVVIRQQHVLNVLFGLAGRGSRSWPLWLRWSVSKVHHVGGIHVGGALAGTASLCAFTVVATVPRARNPASVSVTTLVLSYSHVVLALVVVLCALPPVRSRAHNVFENSHRFGGWTAIGLFWALTLHLDAPGWQVWMLALATREHRLALAAAPARPGDGRAPVLARRDRALRPWRHAGVDVGGRREPQPAPRVARLRDGDHARRIGIPAADLARGRLDRALHRRSPVAPLGARHSGLRADGEDRTPLRAGRPRRHRQRDRTLPRADPGRPRARARLVWSTRDPRATRTSTPRPSSS
jgi:hypothetical protein